MLMVKVISPTRRNLGDADLLAAFFFSSLLPFDHTSIIKKIGKMAILLRYTTYHLFISVVMCTL
jgi:hypothetical protein